MALFIITVNGKAIQLKTLESIFKNALAGKYPKASLSISKKNPATSRRERFDEAMSLISDAKSEMETLRDELQQWRDGLPENLQQSQKADDLDSAISELETAISGLEDAEGSSPEFPGMY